MATPKARVLLPGNAVRRAPTLELRPLVVHWEITRTCRPACLRCRPRDAVDLDRTPLSASEALAVVAQIAEVGAPRLELSGGDYRARPDLDAVIRDAAARGLEVAVVLCASPTRPLATLRRLADAGARRVVVGLDAARIPGATTLVARRVQAVAEAARQAGLALQIDTTVTATTANDLPAVGVAVARLAPALWNVRAAVEPPGGQRGSLDPESFEEMLHHLCAWRARTGLAVQTTAAPALRRVILQQESRLPRAERLRARGDVPMPPALNDGKGIVFIAHTGDVYPSDLLPCVAGNVRRAPLAEIYRVAPPFRELRAYWRLGGKCGACPFYIACGGSRARAYAFSGDLLGEDPSCEFIPLGYTRSTVNEPPS